MLPRVPDVCAVTLRTVQMFGAQAHNNGTGPTVGFDSLADAPSREDSTLRIAQRRQSRRTSVSSRGSTVYQVEEEGTEPNSLTQHCARALHQISTKPEQRNGMVAEVRGCVEAPACPHVAVHAQQGVGVRWWLLVG